MKIKKSNMEKYYTYETSKGLKISIIKRDNATSFHMAMLVNFGGVDTSFINLQNKNFIKTPKGIAHFLEHKMFESKNGDTFERFSKQSANINAYTNPSATVYYFSCTDKIEENIKLFLNCLSNPYITPENVEKEKGIITQEINMYKDNPSARVYENLLDAMYYKNPVKYDVAGSVEDVESTTYNTLMSCYDAFYNCKNMELFIVGEVDPEKVFSLIDKFEGFGKGEKTVKIYPNEPINVKEKYIEEKMPVVDSNFLIGFKLNSKGEKGREILRKEIIYNMLLEYLCGNMSPFYERLYSSGVIDSSFGYGVNIHNKFSFNLLGGVSVNPEKILEEFYGEINNCNDKGIDNESFSSIKKMMMGNYTRVFDDAFSLLNNAITAKNKGGCFLEIIDIANSIEVNDLNRILKEGFGNDSSSLSVITPKNIKNY